MNTEVKSHLRTYDHMWFIPQRQRVPDTVVKYIAVVTISRYVLVVVKMITYKILN